MSSNTVAQPDARLKSDGVKSNVTPLKARASTGKDAARYLSPEQVCELVPGITVANLQQLRKTGMGPKYYKPTGAYGKVIIYIEAEVRAWVDTAVHTTREQS